MEIHWVMFVMMFIQPYLATVLEVAVLKPRYEALVNLTAHL